MLDAQTLTEIIDAIEKIREELLVLQRALEKTESVRSDASVQRRISK